MKEVIISTKGTANARKNVGIGCAIAMVLLGIVVVAFYCYLSEHTRDKSILVILFCGLFALCDGIITAALHYINGTTYVDVYRDRIVGKGIRNLNPQDFNMKNEQIGNVTVQGFWVHIHTNAGTYKVMTDKKTASEIFDYFVALQD